MIFKIFGFKGRVKDDIKIKIVVLYMARSKIGKDKTFNYLKL
jgi:hypothetical protein